MAKLVAFFQGRMKIISVGVSLCYGRQYGKGGKGNL